MRRNKARSIAIMGFAMLVVLSTAYLAMAQDAATPYPKMAPIEQYLMDRTAEIALARSAAPESISGDAEVLVLGRHGFETAVKGKNGFVCIVGRGRSSAADPDFWNPKVRVPICMNSPAARTYLLAITKITDLALAGRNLAQVNEALADATAKKELPATEPGAMCYMTTREFYQIGLSANKTGISVYILGIEDKKYLAQTYGKVLGKASVTGYCIRFKTLKDINIEILEAAIRNRVAVQNEKGGLMK